MTIRLATALLASSSCLFAAAQGPATQAENGFDRNVGVFVKQNCAGCHNEKISTAGLSLTKYHDTASLLRDRIVWEKVVARVRAGEMPPKGMPRPKPEEVASVTGWIEDQFNQWDRNAKPDPGHLTAHRLNRTEYNNTIRDLLAVKFKPASDFPADDSGFGFDNIGEALSVSPVLMEKYLAAAKRIAAQAIPIGNPIPKPTQTRYSPDHGLKEERLELEHTFELPAEGDYDLRTNVAGRKDAFRISLTLDGQEVQASDVIIDKDKPRLYELRQHLAYGEHTLRAVISSREPSAEEKEVAAALEAAELAAIAKQIERHPADEKQIRLQHTVSNPPTYVDALEVRGPFNALAPPAPESAKRFFVCTDPAGQQSERCVRTNLAHFAGLAFRRPATAAEVTKLTKLVAFGQSSGLNFEQSMRLGLQAILVSPNFIYRIERDPNPRDVAAVHTINDYELASRLSYFLWSSTPDPELLTLAGEQRLNQPNVLHAQVKRMLQDAKAIALVDNFAGQWLELRNLDSIRPDPDQYPDFDDNLRRAMYTETHMFFASVVQEDRSILDFIDANYTFLNERLAKFYGIPGVMGNEFRRVALEGDQRSGVLTQASVLTVTSYPTRTSPVLRGKWILENVLNTPPPPPPPGVGSIDAKSGGSSGTMRQIMEKHRANPMCASCHMRMDPLGFSLENYDAIGRWRTQDGGLPIDSAGVLPGGEQFKGAAEMKKILSQNRGAFAECLTEKMITYALGRGVESYDRAATKKIVAGLAADNYRFSSLISGIVDSVPFRMGRGDATGGTE